MSGKNTPTNCCETPGTLNNRATLSVRTSTHPHSTSKSIDIPPSGPLSLFPSLSYHLMPLPLSLHPSCTFSSSFHPSLHYIQFNITVSSVSVCLPQSISSSFSTINIALTVLLKPFRNMNQRNSLSVIKNVLLQSLSISSMQLGSWHECNTILPKQSLSQFNSIFFVDT